MEPDSYRKLPLNQAITTMSARRPRRWFQTVGRFPTCELGEL